jgi:hypothetical protein
MKWKWTMLAVGHMTQIQQGKQHDINRSIAKKHRDLTSIGCSTVYSFERGTSPILNIV